MRILLIFLLLHPLSYVLTQTDVTDNTVIFEKKKNSKTINADLPLAIRIKTKDRIKKDALLVGLTDSTIITLRFVLDKPGALTEETYAIVDRYWTELSKIEEDSTLSDQEKKKKREKLYTLVYTDSISYNISDIKKIEFGKDNPSQLAFYTSYSLYLASGMALMIGMIGSIDLDDDVSNDFTESEKNAFRLVGLSGLVGCAVNLFWMKRIHTNVIYLKRWHIFIREQKN